MRKTRNTGPKRQRAKRPPKVDDANESADTLEFRKALGRRLATLRQNIGMTQQDMAEVSGLGFETVGRIERANREARVGTLFCLSRGLRLSLPEVLAFDHPPPRTHRADTDSIASFLDDKPAWKVAKVKAIVELLFDDGP